MADRLRLGAHTRGGGGSKLPVRPKPASGFGRVLGPATLVPALNRAGETRAVMGRQLEHPGPPSQSSAQPSWDVWSTRGAE